MILRRDDPRHLIYLAGLFDGEGSISVNISGKSRKQLSCSLAMSDRTGPRLFQESFGGCLAKISRKDKGTKDLWAWRISSVKALEFLLALEPHLVIKRDQALLGILFQNFIGKCGVRVTPEQKKARERIALWLSEAKKISIP